jgi:mannose-1-phosphate guanylyltransferase
MDDLHVVILAGGSGTRFWPASRARRPKQFLPLGEGGVSLLQATIDRCRGLVPDERIWIVTNPMQAGLLDQATEGLRRDRVLIEQEARDTAPCVALAAARIGARAPGAVLAVLPADHRIAPPAAFVELLRRGAELAADRQTLVTFGIRPTRPATGFGYIEIGEPLDARSPAAHRVLRFREKPDLATARQFVASGRCLWNSGIFVWSREALLAAMAVGDPQLLAATQRMLEAARAGDEPALAQAFLQAPRKSIDYAIMEKAPRVAVVRADLQWDDLGSFPSLAAVFPPDAAGNVQSLSGGGKAMLQDSKNCIVHAEGRRLVALLGAEDLVVVAVDDAVLVCPKARAEDLKAVIQALRERGDGEFL